MRSGIACAPTFRRSKKQTVSASARGHACEKSTYYERPAAQSRSTSNAGTCRTKQIQLRVCEGPALRLEKHPDAPAPGFKRVEEQVFFLPKMRIRVPPDRTRPPPILRNFLDSEARAPRLCLIGVVPPFQFFTTSTGSVSCLIRGPWFGYRRNVSCVDRGSTVNCCE